MRSRRKGGAPLNLQTRTGSLVRPSTFEKNERTSPPHALKQEERSRQVIRGKRRELHYLVTEKRFMALQGPRALI